MFQYTNLLYLGIFEKSLIVSSKTELQDLSLILDAIKNKDFTTLKDFAEIAKTFGIGATENQ